ncbi:YjbH domain-containing protein [Thalassococcus sp. S3]|uniref:YjbH domain-containing protein n=1 Tax=Thalassococcus sp. S3 TaxID=2017482 RepID=UPI0020C33E96|nr:YjbH domain-containing protein [Thalassococcus sp. S3]
MATAQTAEDAPSFKPLPPPTLNFYGAPGLIDMPSGEASPEGQFTATVSYFGGTIRNTLSFQATPRISASFRYIGIQNWNSDGFDTYYDRSFDVRFLLFRETRRWPAITLGLQDFVGTGIYGGEYIAATKTFQDASAGSFRLPGRLKITAGIGWGRLGTSGSIGSIFGDERPRFDASQSLGGEPAYDAWFRGPAAPFAGIEWAPNDRWGFKVEYSSDAYEPETVQRNVFERKSDFNFGVEYQYSERLRIGAYYLYGSEVGIMANFQLNPKDPVTPLQVAAPDPVLIRPSRRANPQAWSTDWAQSAAAPTTVRDALAPELLEQGLILEAVDVQATSVELRFRNTRYLSMSNAVGRAARTLANIMPPSVETFRIVPVNGGLALSTVTIRRSDLEALEYDADASDAIAAVTGVTDAGRLPRTAALATDPYPEFNWSIGPYFRPSYFDPSNPVRFDLGIEASASYRFARGWVIGGRISHRLAGNVDGGRESNSVLPRVRTDGVLYARGADTTLDQLYISKQWKPRHNLYARVSAGYFENVFGGISGELLWKPASSSLGIGIEANYVKQRDFDQRFGFRDYSVATGHVSAYYDFGGGYHGQIDVGRYLAGDIGATFTLDRQFDNGWRVGGFFTLTDVSSEEFGEGSFDKGIRFSLPVNWFIGTESRRRVSTTVRPIQRDGGARLFVPGRLYEQVREGHFDALDGQSARFWE